MMRVLVGMGADSDLIPPTVPINVRPPLGVRGLIVWTMLFG
jgi:hypothetical protein